MTMRRGQVDHRCSILSSRGDHYRSGL